MNRKVNQIVDGSTILKDLFDNGLISFVLPEMPEFSAPAISSSPGRFPLTRGCAWGRAAGLGRSDLLEYFFTRVSDNSGRFVFRDLIFSFWTVAAWVMKQGKVDAVVTGADRIAGNGDAANKIGTYSVAVHARAHGIPFYVAAPSSTFDPSLASGEQIPIEERASVEITHGFGRQTAPEAIGRVRVRST